MGVLQCCAAGAPTRRRRRPRMSLAVSETPLRAISREEVARHASAESLWAIIDGRVYDLTRFAKFHPGGKQALLSVAGRDATEEFYANHKADILRRSGDKYVIGLVQGEEPGVRGRPAGAVDKGPYAEKSFRRGWRTPYYNDSHAACQTAVRTFLDNELRDDVEKFEEAGKAPSREFYRKMGAAGILAARIGPGPHLAMMERAGVRLPGGVPAAQFDFFHEMLVHQETARLGCPGFVDGIGAGLVIGLPPVMHFGPQWMKEEVGMKVLTGEKIIALAISEAYAGSDVKALRTVARRTPDGQSFVVSGMKKWITNGTFADYFVTAVRTGEGKGTKGISLMLIERGEGVDTKPIKTSYSPAAGTAYVEFDEVVVPARNLIGPLDDGFKCIMANFNHERWMIACIAQGYNRLVLSDAYKWAAQRSVFGKKLIEQPVIRNKLSHMTFEVEGVENTLDHLTYQMNNMSYKEQTAKLAGPIALLKLQTTRVAHRVQDDAVQILGGRGITRTGMGQNVERIGRAYKFMAVYGGSEEIMSDLAAKMAMKTFDMRAKL